MVDQSNPVLILQPRPIQKPDTQASFPCLGSADLRIHHNVTQTEATEEHTKQNEHPQLRDTLQELLQGNLSHQTSGLRTDCVLMSV